MKLHPTPESPTLVMHNMASLRETAGQPVIKFGFGQSPFPPPAVVIEALRANAHRHDYTPVAGIPALRQAVAAHHKQFDDIDCTDKNILISAGSKALLYAAMAAFQNAAVIIPAPAWVSYGPQAELIGHEIVPLPRMAGKDWRITPDDLQQAADQCSAGRDKILIFNAPGNPDGICYAADELQALAEVARKNDMLVISDEIYGRLHFENAHLSMARFYPEKTVVTSGLSKWGGAGGWRLGTAVVPEALSDLRDAMLGILSEIVSCAPTPIQMAALTAYQDSPEMQDALTRRRNILKAIGTHSYEVLTSAGIGCTKPEGGFYCFVDFMPMQDVFAKRGIKDSYGLCEALLQETGVALLAGQAFGMAPDYLSARLAFVDFDGRAALDAAKTENVDEAFLQKYCGKTCQGLAAIKTWLEGLK
ncbi:MAG: aminotransferase class I/II-fold pyridoxal phosphate-dependent enzyme [Pseudomonadota bacterium]|nr:aminotransferase class I/II-fold pyridoxal phosphate-dependent enzyme [Pseudomonadota bacterium]QKK04719.1 MAG: aminotransferase class I/II-fold pyridoxal phosphate-dependent enzyme [Pseudomonadota bacterium]